MHGKDTSYGNECFTLEWSAARWNPLGIWFLSRFIPLRIIILKIGLRDLSFWIKYIGKSRIPQNGRAWLLATALLILS